MHRNQVKEIYKKRRLKDGKEVGQRINVLMQTLVYQSKLPKEERDANLITSTATELKEIKSEPRFRDEFPSFAKFWNFIKKTNLEIYKKNKELPLEEQKPLITLEDIKAV